MAERRKQKIIFVPGKNPKPRPDLHHALLWRCLVRGVELANPSVAAGLAAHPDCFVLIPWNELFYDQYKPAEPDIPWIELLLRKTGPAADDIRQAQSWRMRYGRFMYTIADLFPWLIRLLPDPAVRGAIWETERYFNDHEGVGGRIRELLKAPLRAMFAQNDRVLLIAHSMGSIIAYDALWELDHTEGNPGRVDLLLTLGSPLGMRYVQARLVGYRDADGQRFPGNIRRWRNVSAEGDLTALDPEIANDFETMRSRGLVESIADDHAGVFNYFRNWKGLNVHRSYGYLVQERVGQVIAEWWQGR